MARKAKNDPVAEDTAAPLPPIRKNDLVLALLRRGEGATLEEITSLTGWQPHSTRAVLTGLIHLLATERARWLKR